MKPLRSNRQKEGLARYPNWKASSLKFFSCPFSPLPRQTLLSYSSENHKNTPDMPRSLQTRHVNKGISPPQNTPILPKQQTHRLSISVHDSEGYLRSISKSSPECRQYSQKKLFCYQLVMYCMIISSLNFT